MILWFAIAVIIVASIAAVTCLILGFAGRVPSDLSIGALALVELLLIVQIVVSAIAPAVGNAPSGSVLEFWTYLISAALLPPAAVIWAFIDRTRWATVILGIAAIAVAIMVWRMYAIWALQSA